ncbi:TatD DNase family protein [Devosia enhydra]|uniref:TatD DNase family protein n=1 Tax=Devosia enhydra TaxID=665118 RepID=A0A1K2HZ84_9HYPH|nr:TatD family hydrolase [Devosia enhydra]SFZ85434.1 TatD DNase family protein [Devosia enhydra]
MFVDSHLHLDFDDFAENREAVLARAEAAGVSAFLTISIRVRDFPRIRAIAERYPNVWCTVGTLPHFADEERDVTADEIIALAAHPKVIGIGEAGLDTFYGNASWEAQIDVLRAHCDAARRTGLPLVIHSVRQDEAMAELLTQEHARGAFPILMHAFSGGHDLAQAVLGLGGYISYGGLLTYNENTAQREIARSVPLDRILLETDAPSLAPEPHRDAPNEPAFLRHTSALLARIKGVPEAELALRSTENFYRLFSKASPPDPAG